MEIKKARGRWNRYMAAALGCMLAGVMGCTAPLPAQAAQEGTWTVTVKPSYRDPETGKIEDPGNNEAIGQGMTEKLCGPTGLLETDSSGNTWLTVRYYLSQFVQNVTFEERSGGSYTTLPAQESQSKLPVEGATDIDSKYGYTDYRMKIGSMDSVFRGKAYIEPMGRSVVYFFTVSNPVPGSGDFITAMNSQQIPPSQSGAAAAPGENGAGASASQNGGSKALIEDFVNESRGGAEEKGMQEETQANSGTEYEGAVLTDGHGDEVEGGNADDPVTGIPQKPGRGPDSGISRQSSGASGSEQTAPAGKENSGSYDLQTNYDLSQVPMDQARKLTKPILESAVGITGVTGNVSMPSKPSASDARAKSSQRIMTVLLAAAAVLIVCIGIGAARRRGRKDEN